MLYMNFFIKNLGINDIKKNKFPEPPWKFPWVKSPIDWTSLFLWRALGFNFSSSECVQHERILWNIVITYSAKCLVALERFSSSQPLALHSVANVLPADAQWQRRKWHSDSVMQINFDIKTFALAFQNSYIEEYVVDPFVHGCTHIYHIFSQIHHGYIWGGNDRDVLKTLILNLFLSEEDIIWY